jgi:hypothetical protein
MSMASSMVERHHVEDRREGLGLHASSEFFTPVMMVGSTKLPGRSVSAAPPVSTAAVRLRQFDRGEVTLHRRPGR